MLRTTWKVMEKQPFSIHFGRWGLIWPGPNKIRQRSKLKMQSAANTMETLIFYGFYLFFEIFDSGINASLWHELPYIKDSYIIFLPHQLFPIVIWNLICTFYGCLMNEWIKYALLVMIFVKTFLTICYVNIKEF